MAGAEQQVVLSGEAWLVSPSLLLPLTLLTLILINISLGWAYFEDVKFY